MIPGKKILVVDDERGFESIPELLRMVDKDEGSITLNVTFARNYREACECLKQNEYDVVFMDHDLGCFEMDDFGDRWEYTGYDILCDIESGHFKKPLRIELVTANASARSKMQQVVRKIYGIKQR